MQDLTVDAFAPLVGDTFVLRAADGSIDATLVDATATGDAPAPELRAPFSLLWEGPAAPRLQQGIHEVQHAAFDEPLVVFLVPVDQTETGMRYQAVFN